MAQEYSQGRLDVLLETQDSDMYTRTDSQELRGDHGEGTEGSSAVSTDTGEFGPDYRHVVLTQDQGLGDLRCEHGWDIRGARQHRNSEPPQCRELKARTPGLGDPGSISR